MAMDHDVRPDRANTRNREAAQTRHAEAWPRDGRERKNKGSRLMKLC